MEAHRYLSGHSQHFASVLIARLCIFAGAAPVMLTCLRPIFTLATAYKVRRDTLVDGSRSGRVCRVRAPHVLDALGRLKFVNYGAGVLGAPGPSVQKCYLLGGSKEAWPCAGLAPLSQDGLN